MLYMKPKDGRKRINHPQDENVFVLVKFVSGGAVGDMRLEVVINDEAPEGEEETARNLRLAQVLECAIMEAAEPAFSGIRWSPDEDLDITNPEHAREIRGGHRDWWKAIVDGCQSLEGWPEPTVPLPGSGPSQPSSPLTPPTSPGDAPPAGSTRRPLPNPPPTPGTGAGIMDSPDSDDAKSRKPEEAAESS